MLFVVGLERLERTEKEALLAQVNVLSGPLIIADKASKGLKRAKEFVGRNAERLAGRMSPDAGQKVHAWAERFDWDENRLAGRMAEERERLQRLPEGALEEEILTCLRRIACLNDQHDASAVACAVIHEAAETLKIDRRIYLDAASLEGAVFEAALTEMIEALKKKLESLSFGEQEELETLLREELERLTESDREAICEALGVEELSAGALLALLRSASGVAIVQMLVGGFGFGAFLFLTTMIKAFSLLIGVTLPFAAYSASATVLSFALSLPFFLLFVAATGGWIVNRTNSKIDQQLSKLLVVIGRARLLQDSESSGC